MSDRLLTMRPRLFVPVLLPRILSFLLLTSFVAISVVSPRVGAAQESVAVSGLLSEMSRALREMDYRGLFTYEFGGALQTLRVTHRVMDGEEYENVEFLNGPSRRVERNGRQVECLSPADEVLRGLLPSLNSELTQNYEGLQQHYQFYIRDDERIAGRLATVLQIVPRDDYRYGYTLSIDKKTSLPLGSMTFTSRRKVLERLQFASLDLDVDDSWVGAVGATTDIQRPEIEPCDTEQQQMPWTLGWLPAGFVSAGNSTLPDVGDVQLYTDGLSAFSVFLEPMGKNVAAQGKAQRGATVAYMQQHVFNGKPYTVTVVGEIPAVTAQRIAGSLRWGQSEPLQTLPTQQPPS
ncbi:MucB/RseB C-terminal domain-containing protein [Pseudomaricurvus sp.]|uniref:MucB/RseB C-terminal domain-containing protein n=1 Tax=Pseudomaricurvus sp. TaxID=2004510 RepID=UPI003F6BA2E5